MDPLHVPLMPVCPGGAGPGLRSRNPLMDSILIDQLLDDEAAHLLEERAERLWIGEVHLGCLRQPQAPPPSLRAVVLDVPLPIRSKVPASVPDLGWLEGIQVLESQLDGVWQANPGSHHHGQVAGDRGPCRLVEPLDQTRFMLREVVGVRLEPGACAWVEARAGTAGPRCHPGPPGAGGVPQTRCPSAGPPPGGQAYRRSGGRRHSSLPWPAT